MLTWWSSWSKYNILILQFSSIFFSFILDFVALHSHIFRTLKGIQLIFKISKIINQSGISMLYLFATTIIVHTKSMPNTFKIHLQLCPKRNLQSFSIRTKYACNHRNLFSLDSSRNHSHVTLGRF